MSGRILPKKDYEKVIEHDKLYCQALSEKFEFHTIKQDLLRKECSFILNNQTKESIIKNIDVLCEWSNVKMICLDTKAHLHIQKRLIEDKEKHYNLVFLPQYKKEIAECIEHFDSIVEDCRTFIKDKPKMSEEILPKIQSEFYWYDNLTKEEKNEEEYKLQIFKSIRRLLNAYTNLIKNGN